MRNADKRLGQERHRVEVFIGNSTINSSNSRFSALIVLHIQNVVLNKKVGILHKNSACFFRKIAVLEICRVVSARRQNYVNSAAVHIIHHTAQKRRVVSVINNVAVLESVRACHSAKLARYQRVARARRYPQIILEYVPFPVLSLHQVNAGNMAVNRLRRLYPRARRKISL